MIKIDNRTPLSRVQLLQLQSVNTSPIKRNIKISNQKFPVDFFKDVQRSKDKNQIFQSMSKIHEQINRNNSRNLPQTQQQVRNGIFRLSDNRAYNSDIKRKQMSTALQNRGDRLRNSNQYQEQLIKSVLTTAREIKKIIRKHSIELRKNYYHNKDQVVQLPPLKLKRGFTAEF